MPSPAGKMQGQGTKPCTALLPLPPGARAVARASTPAVPCTPSLPGKRGGQRNKGIHSSQEPGPVHEKPRGAKLRQQGLGGRWDSHLRACKGFLPEKRALLPALILPTYFSANSDLASGHSVLFDLSEGINLPPPLPRLARYECLEPADTGARLNAGLCCRRPCSLPTPLLPKVTSLTRQ